VLQILDGLRLIEVADWGFVPSAATVLGDWGADVIKIEHPVRGDPMRGLVTSGLVPGARGVNFFVEHLSRNKPRPAATCSTAWCAPPTSS